MSRNRSKKQRRALFDRAASPASTYQVVDVSMYDDPGFSPELLQLLIDLLEESKRDDRGAVLCDLLEASNARADGGMKEADANKVISLPRPSGMGGPSRS